jgi:hypothetical protein
MSKQIILLIIVIVIIALLGGGIYYFIYKNMFMTPTINQTKEENTADLIKKDFPDVVVGIITISSNKGIDSAIIKTDDGKEWSVWPDRPQPSYEHEGIKTGQKVELRGKISDENRIQWRLIRPI